MLGFPVHTKDEDGKAFVCTGVHGVALFWVSVIVFVGEATAPLWAQAAMAQAVWPRVSPMVWFLVGPALTALLAAVYLVAVWANCRRRKFLSVFAFVAGYVLTILAILIKAALIYANRA